MCGLQCRENVNVISYATDDLRCPAQSGNCATQVFMQSHSPCIRDRRLPVLGGEDQVIQKLCMG